MSAVQINPAALRAIRERSGMSQARLAEAADVDRSHLVNIEAGRRNASDETIVSLAKALKVELPAIIADPTPDPATVAAS